MDSNTVILAKNTSKIELSTSYPRREEILVVQTLFPHAQEVLQ
jgi:hypothetical protein